MTGPTAAHRTLRTLALSLRLFQHTLGAKYRKSFLGYLWIIVPSLLITSVVWLAHRSGVIAIGATNLPYPLFVLTGVLLWHSFVEAIDVVYRALDGARSYITRVMFPREAMVLAQAYEALINLAVRYLFVTAVSLFFIAPAPSGLAIAALAFATVFLLGLGLGAVLAPFMMLISDLHETVKLVLSYGIFFTPALYVPGHGLFASIIALNPVSEVMRIARTGIASGAFDAPQGFLALLAAALALVLLGLVFVRRAVPIVVERMLLGGR